MSSHLLNKTIKFALKSNGRKNKPTKATTFNFSSLTAPFLYFGTLSTINKITEYELLSRIIQITEYTSLKYDHENNR